MNNTVTVEHQSLLSFAKRFIAGKIRWSNVPRLSIINYTSIISMLLYRELPFQVELFIVPFAPSCFPNHCHPDVDSIEYPLSGDSWLKINNQLMWTDEQKSQWLNGNLPSVMIPISHDDWHEGGGITPYAFLSIQQWLHDTVPTSVGLNWLGKPSSVEQEAMLSVNSVTVGVNHG